jgi:thiol-disulfide isomerase/thioredoxin
MILRFLVVGCLCLACRPAMAVSARPRLTVFWGIGCPHCEEARPVVAELVSEFPNLSVNWIEVRHDAAGRAQFFETAKRLGVEGAGVPMFVVGDRPIVGFRKGFTDQELRRAIQETAAGAAPAAPSTVELPVFGTVDPSRISFPLFTVLIALADGINPCAFYVLIVLLGLLLHVPSRRRVALYGGVFVVMSGVVYFVFMTVWLGFFLAIGGSRWITIVLGAAMVGMGLVNLKELIWFKRGVSLMIPERSKPGLFRRMRRIADSASLPAAIVGITALAFVVNLVELGCTLGLPAIYTRLLSLHRGLSTAGRYAYLVLYNAVYVVPLALIVAGYVLTLTRIAMTERRAKVLKAVSGVLLVVFGVTVLVAPNLLR